MLSVVRPLCDRHHVPMAFASYHDNGIALAGYAYICWQAGCHRWYEPQEACSLRCPLVYCAHESFTSFDPRLFLITNEWKRGRKRSKLLNGTNADAVRLTQGAIDGTGFGHPHLGAANQGR